MMETIYIRANNDVHDAPCDVAAAALRKTGSTSSEAEAYLGMVAGSHHAQDALAQLVIDPANAWQWVSSQGYERVPQEPW